MTSLTHVKKEPPTKYRRPKPEEPLYLILDPGNTDVKAMLHLHFGEEIWFPHAVRKPNSTEYKDLAAKFRFRPAQFEGTAIFSLRLKGDDGSHYDQGYVVGMHASQVGEGIRLTGAQKYTRDHVGALFVAAALQLYPASHPDVHVVVLHPADVSGDALEKLGRAIYGKHVVKLPDGREITYRVSEVIPLEEPVAGLQDFVLTTQGSTYSTPKFNLQPGMQFLVLDVGGGFTGFVPCLITRTGKIEVNITGSPVIEVGIQNVMPALEAELKDEFEVLRPLTRLPESLLVDALMTGSVSIKGESFPCEKRVANAMTSIASPISQIYKNTFKGGVAYFGIVVTGGGGGITFEHLRTHVLDHKYVFPAEKDLTRMRFGGIRGGSKGLITFLKQARVAQPELDQVVDE